MEKKRTIIFISAFLLLSATLMAAELEVEYKCENPTANTQQIQVHLNILNNSHDTIPMADLQVRYYYTKEDSTPEVMNIDYAMFGSSNVTYMFAEGYLKLGFTSGAGTIISGNESGEILLRFHKKDWSAYDQSNDFSFNPASEILVSNPNIALYFKGVLVWGTTPEGDFGSTPDGEKGPTPSPSQAVAVLEEI